MKRFMALDANGQSIHCDGERCEATTPVPVALHCTLNAAATPPQGAQGWLFVVSADRRLHFCPLCARRIQQLYTGSVG